MVGIMYGEVGMMKCFDIKSEARAVLHEIMEYKWIESEKVGYDIGENRAADEWINQYYENWMEINCEKFYKEN